MSVGAYLEIIRKRRSLSRADMALKMKVSTQTIANIENGDKEAGSSLLFQYIDIVNANLWDVSRLMLAPENEQVARVRAEQAILAEAEMSEAERLRGEIGNDRVARAAAFLAENPHLIDGLIQLGYAAAAVTGGQSSGENRPLSVSRSGAQQ